MADADEPFVPLLEESDEADAPQILHLNGHGDTDPIETRKLAAKKFFAERCLRILTKDLNFNEFIQELLLDLLKVVECEAASVVEVDYSRNVMFFRTATGFSSDSIRRFTFPRGQGIAGQCAELKKPILIDEISENKSHLKSIEQAVGFKTQNMLAVPILIRGKSFAVFELLNRKKADSFSEADLDIVQYCCDMAAKAIEVRMVLAWTKQGKTAA